MGLANPLDDVVEGLASAVLDAAFRVHSELGPGLLESIYETCLSWELDAIGIPFVRQAHLPIRYRNLTIDGGLRLDLLVDERLIVEIKSTDSMSPVHKAQVMSYLKLSGLRLGLLLSFNVVHMRDGIKRIVI
jgi:GxxExxY protein